jgi:hypothetical protein
MSRRMQAFALATSITLLASCDAGRTTDSMPVQPNAITFGVADTENRFSNVGAFVVQDPETGQIYPICSGTLIAPTVFLTAAHCNVVYNLDLAPLGYTPFVSFANPLPWGDMTDRRTKLVPIARIITNPRYSVDQKDSGDIGVLIIAERHTRGVTPATLPTLGVLDQLATQGTLQTATFTPVGYGVQERVVGGGQPHFQDTNPLPRRYAFSSFNALSPGTLRLSQNPATGNGGTCFGDSGGPNFLDVAGVATLVATTMTGDDVCRSTNVTYRLDTTEARSFLGRFLSLP